MSTVSPVVLLNISDQATRSQVQKTSFPVCGVLLGRKLVSGAVYIGHSIPQTTSDQSILASRIGQYKVIHPDLEVIGIYSLVSVSAEDLQSLVVFLRLADFFHLQISFATPATPYALARCIVDRGSALVVEPTLPVRTAACAWGKVAVADLSRTEGRGGDWQAQLQNELTLFSRAKTTLHRKLETLREYERAVQTGNLAGDAELLEEIGSLTSELERGVISGCIPNASTAEGIARLGVVMTKVGSSTSDSVSFSRPRNSNK